LSRCPVLLAHDLSGFAFSSLLSFSLRVSRRRRCGNVEIRRFWVGPDFQARWKEWESPPFDFSTLSTARHFHSVARAVFSPPPATGLAPCTVPPRGDRRGWSPARPSARRYGAEFVGYVYDVKPGLVESVNCSAHHVADRDTHIELVLNPMGSSPTSRMIVEVTPRRRAIMASRGVDWSTRALRDHFLG